MSDGMAGKFHYKTTATGVETHITARHWPPDLPAIG